MSHDRHVHGDRGQEQLQDDSDGHHHAHGDDCGHHHAHGDDNGHHHAHGDDSGHHHAHGDDNGHHYAHADRHRHATTAGFRAGDAPTGWRKDREPGFGAGRVLFFDAFSGVAGDMTVAALVDLGVPQAVVENAVRALDLEGCQLHFRHGYVGSIGALKFDVEVAEGQKERDYQLIDRMIGEADLDAGVRSRALAVFRRLAQAEAAVHRTPIESVHFHEVGAVDSIADIVGACACLEYIGATVWVSPLPMGRGFIDCRHGVIPLPAPATIHCLVGIVTKDAGIEAELVTPTGAALIGTVAKRCVHWPKMAPVAIGWGAGSRVLPDRPNLLRVVLGDSAVDQESDADVDADHVVIEANVDDATGELSGHALGLLLEAGALDAWAVPITMKKGRPGVVLSAIVAPENEQRLTALLIRETTTLGVRRHLAGRTVRPRRMIQVQTRYGTIPVKVSEGPFGPPQVKPEFDHCAQLARERSVPVREVLAVAVGAARHLLALDED